MAIHSDVPKQLEDDVNRHEQVVPELSIQQFQRESSYPESAPPKGPSGRRQDQEAAELFEDVLGKMLSYIKGAEIDSTALPTGQGFAASPGAENPGRTLQASSLPPKDFVSRLKFANIIKFPEQGVGKDELAKIVGTVMDYSVNTWCAGFMDKLYASTNPVGLLWEVILATLNTNVHVFTTSPMLTLIEKITATTLAKMFGFAGEHAGGISQPGGSACNSSSIVIARNTLFPETKTNGIGDRKFCLFTSAHGHYSVKKAAQMFGFGSNSVIPVEVDSAGRMRAEKLEEAIERAREEGNTPFYVNATAGTTVIGSFDPFEEIAEVCRRHRVWMHIDGSWGGSLIFSKNLAFEEGRLKGADRADSIAISPHKMLGVPLTCSFLLGKDMRQFWKAMTLRAGYLFHTEAGIEPGWDDMYDLADLTPQCGRKGESLKLFLSWVYYGADYYRDMVEFAYKTANYFVDILEKHPNFVLVSKRPLPCLQVCFYWAKGQNMVADKDINGQATAAIHKKLIDRGWLIDYAPGDEGKFFRVVVNGRTTTRPIVDGLVKAIDDEGLKLGISETRMS